MNERNKRQGWIKLFRSIQENDLWSEKPFDKARAWIDLLLLANHEERYFSANGQSIKVEPGTLITSMYKLAERWGWSKSSVLRFLNRIEGEAMIVRKAERKWNAISIVNWRSYQDTRNEVEPKVERSRTEVEPKAYPNKNKEQRTNNLYMPKPNKFNQFPQRDKTEIDYDDLERRKINGG